MQNYYRNWDHYDVDKEMDNLDKVEPAVAKKPAEFKAKEESN